MYHYFYKITNKTNGKFYYGIHSTDNLDDGYMGSGSALKRAYKKEGKDNFHKEIIRFFDNRQDLEDYEKKIVNENLVYDNSCYNIATGGCPNKTIGSVLVKDENGICFRVLKTDEDLISEKLNHPSKNTVTAISKLNNKTCVVDINEFYKNKDLYRTHSTGKVVVKNENDETVIISVEEYHHNKNKYKHFATNKIVVKDKDGNTLMVDKTDERFINGELTLFWCGKKHSESTKNKISEVLKKNKHQQGEKNSQYGTCWVNNGIETIRIKKEELNIYLDKGYIRGRLIKDKSNILLKNQDKIWINKNEITKFVYKNELVDYIKDGWFYGRVPQTNFKRKKIEGFKLFCEIYKTVFNKDYC